MKIIKLSVAMLVLASATFVSCKKEIVEVLKTTEVKVIASNETTKMNVEGMTCAVGCAKVIENKLAQLEGVQKATINFETKEATVEYNPSLQTPEKLVETIEAVAGGKTYKVSNVKNSADKAMFFQENPTQEKPKKAKKAKKGDVVLEASTSATTPTVPTAAASCAPAEKKGGCCSAKKSCASSKPATL